MSLLGDGNRENLRHTAQRTVRRAIKNGLLEKIGGTTKCFYCDNHAEVYDHRDYTKPLDVHPVCLSCNATLPCATPISPSYIPKSNYRWVSVAEGFEGGGYDEYHLSIDYDFSNLDNMKDLMENDRDRINGMTELAKTLTKLKQVRAEYLTRVE